MRLFANSQPAVYSFANINRFESDEEKRRQRSLAAWIAMNGGRMNGNQSSGSSGGGRGGSHLSGVVTGGQSGSSVAGGIPAQ